MITDIFWGKEGLLISVKGAYLPLMSTTEKKKKMILIEGVTMIVIQAKILIFTVDVSMEVHVLQQQQNVTLLSHHLCERLRKL